MPIFFSKSWPPCWAPRAKEGQLGTQGFGNFNFFPQKPGRPPARPPASPRAAPFFPENGLFLGIFGLPRGPPRGWPGPARFFPIHRNPFGASPNSAAGPVPLARLLAPFNITSVSIRISISRFSPSLLFHRIRYGPISCSALFM